MNKIIILIFMLISFSFASLLDFKKLPNIYSLYNSGNYKDSLLELKSLNRDTPRVNYDIANILYKQGKFKKAINYYKRSFGKGVNEASRIYNLANCYFKLKEWDSAIFSYKIALKLKDDADAKYNLALAYKMKNAPKKESKKSNKKEKKKQGEGKKDKNQKGKKGKTSKKSTQKDRKLTKEELKKLQELERKEKFKKELKKMLNRSLKDKKAPVLMYRIDSGAKNKRAQELKPW